MWAKFNRTLIKFQKLRQKEILEEIYHRENWLLFQNRKADDFCVLRVYASAFKNNIFLVSTSWSKGRLGKALCMAFFHLWSSFISKPLSICHWLKSSSLTLGYDWQSTGSWISYKPTPCAVLERVKPFAWKQLLGKTQAEIIFLLWPFARLIPELKLDIYIWQAFARITKMVAMFK